MLLYNLLKEGYGQEENLNCAEQILYGANIAYDLGLNKEALKLAGGFGGGMAIEDKCGALTGAIMVMSSLFIDDVARDSLKLKDLIKELFNRYEDAMGSIDCAPLMDMHRTEEEGCRHVILKAAEILDAIVREEGCID